MQTRALRRFLVDFALALTQGALYFGQLNVARLAFGLCFVELRLQLFNLRGKRIAASRALVELLLQRGYFLFEIRDAASTAHRGVFGLLATGSNRTRLFGKKHIGRLKALDHHVKAPALRGEVAYIQAFFLKRQLQRFKLFFGLLGFDFPHIDARGSFVFALQRRIPLALQRAQIIDREHQIEPGEFVGQALILLGALRLASKRFQLALNLGRNVFHAREARIHARKLALGALLALLVLQNARSFLDERATIFGFARENGVELALADDGMRARAKAGIVQDVHEVHAAGRRAVDEVFAFTGTVHAAGERHLVEIDGQRAVGIIEHEFNLGDADAFAGRRARKNDVFHGLAAQILRVALTKHPQHRVGDIRFARAVRTDDCRDARFERNHGTVGERLKPFQDQGFQMHVCLLLAVLRSCLRTLFLLALLAFRTFFLLARRLSFRLRGLLGVHFVKRGFRCLAFGFFLRAAHARSKRLHAREHLRHEGAIVRGTLGLDELVRRRDAFFLQLFLQGALRIFRLLRHVDAHARNKRALDEELRAFDAGIEIQSRDNGLVHVLKRRMQATPTRAALRGAKHDDVGKAKLFGDVGKARARNECHFNARKAALIDFMVGMEGFARHHGAQNGIAEEFEALIRELDRLAFGCRGVRDCSKQNLGIFELVTQNLLGELDLLLLLLSMVFGKCHRDTA